MNVLFYLFQNIDEASGSIGGIERHTLTLKKGLEPYGFKFFLAFSNHDEVSELDYDKSLLIELSLPIISVPDMNLMILPFIMPGCVSCRVTDFPRKSNGCAASV